MNVNTNTKSKSDTDTNAHATNGIEIAYGSTDTDTENGNNQHIDIGISKDKKYWKNKFIMIPLGLVVIVICCVVSNGTKLPSLGGIALSRTNQPNVASIQEHEMIQRNLAKGSKAPGGSKAPKRRELAKGSKAPGGSKAPKRRDLAKTT